MGTLLWRKLACPILFLLPLAAFAGQSLILKSSSGFAVSDPVLALKKSWRIEFQLHNFTAPAAGVYTAKLFDLPGTGANARISPDGVVAMETADRVAQQQPCFVNPTGLSNVLIRMQRDVSAMLFTCELWNFDGTGYRIQVTNISTLVPRTDGEGAIGTGASASLGFLRVATTLVSLGGRPPTTADAGDWTELKFDGDLKDSSGHHHNASGSATYMATPNQGVFAYPRTSGAPSWSSWTSLRAGYPGRLDGLASYSLSDGSSAVSCRWQQSGGPTTVIWTNPNTPTPTLEGLIFGTYDFALQVTDAAGNTASAKLQVGAVATDDHGVVVNADPNVDKIFGPMIAFGKNPWGYADERAMTATRLRMAAYRKIGLDPPPWAVPGPGTVTYIFNGVGGYDSAPGSRLSSSIGAADTVIAVADASLLDLTTLPARILLGGGPKEELRICGASATRGPATLTLCYDGRGQSSPLDGYRTQPQAWPKGAIVGQMKVTGSGTNFLSSICPAGPGPNGKALYRAGSARLTAGSPEVTGNHTVWNATNQIFPGYLIRVAATHGGVPFIFTAYISSVADPAHLKLARAYPADADSGAFLYSIIQADFLQISLHYRRTNEGTDAQTYFQTSGCESDNDVYVYSGHDIANLNGTLQRSKQYSHMDGFGYASAFGANFYGEDLAHRALYYRSGWNPALHAARVFGDHYVSSPQLAGGDAGGIPLLQGGGVIGGFAAAVLDTSDPNRPSWSDLRGFARNGSIGRSGCSTFDTRDSGYMGTWLTLAAEFDPDPAQQANWKTQLSQLLMRDERCEGKDKSWSNGFLWNNNSAPLTMTHGSPTVTGNGIPPALCFGIASGAMSVVKGSATAAGSGFVPGSKIAITGSMKGNPYTGFFQFKINTNGSITLAALWPGDSGTVSWVIENNDYLTTIATSNDDPQLSRNWACTWKSSSQITLNRPWDGPTETGAHLFSYVLAGYGQQRYMLGIKILQMKLASQLTDGTISSAYKTMAAGAAGWVHDMGYDPVTQGMHYGRVFQACEPDTVPPPNAAFNARTPGCNNGLEAGAVRAARVLTAETSHALRAYYESNPTAEARRWGDVAYGSIWGNPLYTTGGVYHDSNYVRDENSNGSLGAYKWTGFFFGMGMAHQWPAVRLGGVSAPRPRKVELPLKAGVAAKAQVVVTEPCGKVDIFSCAGTSRCGVTVDDRQGNHWYHIQYLSAKGDVLSQTDPALIGP